ncbi:MAG: secondary thiamine-phosphate synthase enzyme YjbQ [Candidatus Omnitrophota bacterium]
MKKISIQTLKKVELIDITQRVQEIVNKSNFNQGICVVFVPHTTAGVTINENADPDVCADIVKELNKVIPFNDHYAHSEGNSAAHIKASLMGFSEIIIIENKQLQLGTWQGIYFTEFDGPRVRNIWVKLLKSSE